MMAVPFDLIIFDFDGVVADSELLANTLLADYLTSLGKPTTVDDSIRLFMGKRPEDIAALAIDWIGRPDMTDFSERYRDYSRPRMLAEVETERRPFRAAPNDRGHAPRQPGSKPHARRRRP